MRLLLDLLLYTYFDEPLTDCAFLIHPNTAISPEESGFSGPYLLRLDLPLEVLHLEPLLFASPLPPIL